MAQDHNQLTTSQWRQLLATFLTLPMPHHANLLSLAAQHHDPSVHLLALADPHCPQHILVSQIKRRSSPETLIAIASNTATPVEGLVKISKFKKAELDKALAQNPATPREVQIKLATSTRNQEVLHRLAARIDLNAELLALLSQRKNAAITERLLGNPQTPTNVIREILEGKVDLVALHAAARNPQTPRNLLSSWALAGKLTLRRLVAKNPKLAPQEIEALAWINDSRCQEAVASNPSIPEKLALQLCADTIPTETQLYLATNSALCVQAVEQLLVNTSPKVRELVLLYQNNLKSNLLQQVAAEETDENVVIALLTQTNLSHLLLQRIANLPNATSRILVALACTPSKMTPALHKHIWVSDLYAGCQSLTRPDAPIALIRTASKSTHTELRRACASSSKTTSTILATLTTDEDPIVSILAATHPKIAVA